MSSFASHLPLHLGHEFQFLFQPLRFSAQFSRNLIHCSTGLARTVDDCRCNASSSFATYRAGGRGFCRSESQPTHGRSSRPGTARAGQRFVHRHAQARQIAPLVGLPTRAPVQATMLFNRCNDEHANGIIRRAKLALTGRCSTIGLFGRFRPDRNRALSRGRPSAASCFQV